MSTAFHSHHRAYRCALLVSIALFALVPVLHQRLLPIVDAATTTLTVDTTTDTNARAFQACTPAPNDCSLRGAISRSNATAATAYTIALPAGRYVLGLTGSGENNNARGDLDIAGNLTINGAEAANTIIDGHQVDRVLHIGGTVTMNAVTIVRGRAVNDGTSVSGQFGGGVRNEGTLTITNSIIRDNEAAGFGGGIYNTGAITLTTSILQGNDADFDGGGIANSNDGRLNIRASVISANGAALGGGIRNDGTMSITSSTISGNTATDAGGGVLTTNDLTLEMSTVNDNTGLRGGGLLNQRGNLSIRSSTINGNTAAQNGGGVTTSFGTLLIINSTISGNNARLDGGGIANENDSTTRIAASTIADNTANSGNTFGAGGGMYSNTGTISATHTLIVGNNSGTDASAAPDDCDVGSSYTSQGYNLVGTGTGCASTGPSDQRVAPATVFTTVLGPLAENGGPALTHALLPGSPAIDAGDPAFDTSSFVPPLTTDQRGTGFPRIIRDQIDIGAYETTRFALSTVKTVDTEAPTADQRLTYTITATNESSVATTDVVISDTLPDELTFAGPAILDPPQSGATLAQNAADLPYIASGLTIPAREHITVTFPVTVNIGLADGMVITNTVTVTSTEVPTPVESTAVITVINPPNFTVNTMTNVTTAEVGQTITYTYHITNTGSMTMTNIRAIHDTLGVVPLEQTTVAPGQSTTGILTYTVQPDDLPGPLITTVVMIGTFVSGASTTVEATTPVMLVSTATLRSIYLPAI